MRDLYQILGVNRDAEAKEIKAAYRRRAQQVHPDMPGGSKEAFLEVQRAYAVLIDPKLRIEYDKTGAIPEDVVDNKDANAIQILAELLDQMLADNLPDPDQAPLIDMFNNLISANMEKLKGQRTTLRRQLARNEKITKRMKRKKKAQGAGPIAALLANQKQKIQGSIALLSEGIDVHKRAKEILADYEYSAEIMQRITTGATATTDGGYSFFRFGE